MALLLMQTVCEVVCMIVPAFFCVFFTTCVFSVNCGVCWGSSKVSAKYQELRYF